MIKSLFNACVTNKYFYNLCEDEHFWRERSYKKNFKELHNKEKTQTWKQFYLYYVLYKTTLLGCLTKFQGDKNIFRGRIRRYVRC
jgi:hypothetical protein